MTSDDGELLWSSHRRPACGNEIWSEAARHNEPLLAALVMSIATINLWNRLNVATRQVTGPWIAQYI